MAANFGGAQPKTQDQKALDALKTDQYTFVNKDFVKNMAFLNQTVDIHTAFLGKLQSGVDSANENIIEQIQGFAADLFLIFAGMEPTGIDIGDLKYVLQAIGAIFGINPNTPFPLNLFDAVGHMFSNFIVPLSQFTDVIFDAIFAWAHELGFSDDFLDAVKHLKDSVEALGSSIYDFFTRILSLFDIFGIFNGASGAIGGLMSNILDFFSDIVFPSLKPIINAISYWSVPFINALSGTINTLTRLINGLPIGHITNKQVNLALSPGFDDSTTMQTGFGWSWDSTQGKTAGGSARCIANSAPRKIVSDHYPVDEGQTLSIGVWVKWTGIVYTADTPIALCLDRFNGDNLIDTIVIAGSASPAINQTTWLQLLGTYVVPSDCDSVRIALRVGANASSGTVWFDDATLYKQSQGLPQSWILNLIPDIGGLRDFIQNVIDGVTGVVGSTLSGLASFMGNLGNNVASALNQVGTLAYNLLHNTAAVLGTIGQDLVSGLGSALSGLNTFIQNVIEGIIGAIRGIPFVGAGIADLVATLTGYKKNTTATAVATKNFVMSSMAIVRQPGWTSDYPLSAVSYPGVFNSKFSVFADTVGPATAGTAHSHAIRGTTDNAQAIAPFWGYTAGNSVGGFVTATQDMVFSGFSFAAYATTKPVAGQFFYEVLRQNPDGSLALMVSSDISTFIDTSSQTIDNVWNSYRLVAMRGEQYLCRIRNASASNTIYVRGLQWDVGSPDIQWETVGATDSNKTAYTAAQHATISSNSVVCAWVSLNADTNDVPEAYTWTDDFERVSLGYFWNQSLTDTGGDCIIKDGQLQYGGTTNGYQQVLYIRPVATDQFRVDANILNVAGTGFTSLVCGADREAQNSISIAVGLSAVRINTTINGTVVTRATISQTNNSGKWSLTYNSTTKVYTALFNDAPVGLSWTDSSSIVPKGLLYRYSHIQLQRASGVNSATIDDWLVQDWTAT